MNVKDVEAEVERIRAMADDPETAHTAEDALYIGVLQEIVRQGQEPHREGESSPYALAEAALEAVKVSSPRWCA